MPSQRDALKRALVSLIRSLAQAFGCHVAVSRDSTDQEVRQAYRAVARKVHPDKPGGSKEEFQKLSAAHVALGNPAQTEGAHKTIFRRGKIVKRKNTDQCFCHRRQLLGTS